MSPSACTHTNSLALLLLPEAVFEGSSTLEAHSCAYRDNCHPCQASTSRWSRCWDDEKSWHLPDQAKWASKGRTGNWYQYWSYVTKIVRHLFACEETVHVYLCYVLRVEIISAFHESKIGNEECCYYGNAASNIGGLREVVGNLFKDI